MKWERDNDPTYLSHIQVRVASVVQDILQIPEAHVPEHITVRALQPFKESYKNFSITCRYSICRYQENVFHSEKDRDTHESTHIRAYKCPDCDFYARGFATKRNLSKHQERYHMHTEDFQLPEQISPGRDLAIAFPGNQALQDYSLQLFLLEKQKQKRLLKEKDSSHGSEQLEALVNQESLVSDTYKMQMPVLEEHDKAAGVNDLLPNEERRKRQQLDPQQQQWTTMSSLDPDVLSQKMDREEEASVSDYLCLHPIHYNSNLPCRKLHPGVAKKVMERTRLSQQTWKFINGSTKISGLSKELLGLGMLKTHTGIYQGLHQPR